MIHSSIHLFILLAYTTSLTCLMWPCYLKWLTDKQVPYAFFHADCQLLRSHRQSVTVMMVQVRITWVVWPNQPVAETDKDHITCSAYTYSVRWVISRLGGDHCADIYHSVGVKSLRKLHTIYLLSISPVSYKTFSLSIWTSVTFTKAQSSYPSYSVLVTRKNSQPVTDRLARNPGNL